RAQSGARLPRRGLRQGGAADARRRSSGAAHRRPPPLRTALERGQFAAPERPAGCLPAAGLSGLSLPQRVLGGTRAALRTGNLSAAWLWPLRWPAERAEPG